jgi:hypothetical protein
MLQKKPPYAIFLVNVVFYIVQIFKENKLVRILVNTMHVVIAILFAMHTLTLAAR